MDNALKQRSEAIGRALARKGWMLATAESCTGGWIAETITATAGSSEWFDRGFVTYSNQAKQDMLDVAPATLAAHGAVSEQTVAEMVTGALLHSHADVAVAVSGIAGPGGGTPAKPVGTVCFAWALCGSQATTETWVFEGDREAIRLEATLHAIDGLIARIDAEQQD